MSSLGGFEHRVCGADARFHLESLDLIFTGSSPYRGKGLVRDPSVDAELLSAMAGVEHLRYNHVGTFRSLSEDGLPLLPRLRSLHLGVDIVSQVPSNNNDLECHEAIVSLLQEVAPQLTRLRVDLPPLVGSALSPGTLETYCTLGSLTYLTLSGGYVGKKDFEVHCGNLKSPTKQTLLADKTTSKLKQCTLVASGRGAEALETNDLAKFLVNHIALGVDIVVESGTLGVTGGQAKLFAALDMRRQMIRQALVTIEAGYRHVVRGEDGDSTAAGAAGSRRTSGD